MADHPENPDDPEKLPGEADLELNVKSMKAFAHPLRMAMYGYLSDHGSATATMLAEHLGESTGQTSYHLRQLEKHGLVTDDPDRGTGRERWWKPVGFSVRRDLMKKDTVGDPALQSLMEAQLDERFRHLRDWMTNLEGQSKEWINASVDSTATADMTVSESRAMVTELMSVIERHTEEARQRSTQQADTDDGDDEQRVRVYLNVFPLTQ